ncbi:MAG: hypothetical protein Kow0092_25350 [Deferrisomatales bacterium]
MQGSILSNPTAPRQTGKGNNRRPCLPGWEMGFPSWATKAPRAELRVARPAERAYRHCLGGS